MAVNRQGALTEMLEKSAEIKKLKAVVLQERKQLEERVCYIGLYSLLIIPFRS